MENIRNLCESIKTNCAKNSGVKAPQVSTILKPKTSYNKNGGNLVRQTSKNSGLKTPDKDGYFYMM